MNNINFIIIIIPYYKCMFTHNPRTCFPIFNHFRNTIHHPFRNTHHLCRNIATDVHQILALFSCRSLTFYPILRNTIFQELSPSASQCSLPLIALFFSIVIFHWHLKFQEPTTPAHELLTSFLIGQFSTSPDHRTHPKSAQTLWV